MGSASPMKFVILGAGAWGSALALHLARLKNHVILWGRNASHLEDIKNARVNARYLGDIQFPDQIEIESDLATALNQPEPHCIIIATPSKSFERLIDQIKPLITDPLGIVVTSKGLTQEGQTLCAILDLKIDFIPNGLLSGPSFAKEVAMGLPTAVTFASLNPTFSQTLIHFFHHENFRVYQSQDLIGVALGGCIKNVLAIAVGISDGLGLGANARAALMTRGLAEMMRLGAIMGARAQTLTGLTGLGDLILTCTDNQSRNRRFGLNLGKGLNVEEAIERINQAVEGYDNAQQIQLLSKSYQASMPICNQVYQVLYQGQLPKDAFNALIQRPPISEIN